MYFWLFCMAFTRIFLVEHVTILPRRRIFLQNTSKFCQGLGMRKMGLNFHKFPCRTHHHLPDRRVKLMKKRRTRFFFIFDYFFGFLIDFFDFLIFLLNKVYVIFLVLYPSCQINWILQITWKNSSVELTQGSQEREVKH